jgi:hypothetical protein
MSCCGSPSADDNQPYPFDPVFDGIHHDRKCTDVFFCTFFTAFIVGMLGIVFATLPRSDPRYLYTPTDHRGLLCGGDNSQLATTAEFPNASALPDLSDRPFLFWVRQGKSDWSRSVCVAACPSEGLFADAMSSIADLAARGYTGFDPTHNCGLSVQASVENYSSNSSDRYFCPYVTKKVLHRCLPATQAFANVSDVDGMAGELAAFGPAIDAAPIVGRAVEDVYETIWVIGCCTVVALVLSIVWLAALQFCARCVVLGTLFLAVGGLLGLTVVCYLQSKNTFKNFETIESFTFGTISQKRNKEVFTIIFYVMLGVDAVFLLVLILLFKRILLSVKVVELVSRLFGSVPGLFGLPFVIYAIMAVWWSFVVFGACVIFGAGDRIRSLATRSDGSIIDRVDMKYDRVLQGLAIYHFCGFLWVSFFISAVGELTVAGVIAARYFDRDKSSRSCCSGDVSQSFWRSLRYHSGSLALGSLLIAVCKIVRALVEYIHQKTNNSKSCAARCCAHCLDSCVRYISRNAYALIAIHGYSFCGAAGRACGLIVRNAARAVTLNWVGDFALLLGRIVVAAAATILALSLIPIAKPDAQFVVVPAVLVFVCAWLAAAAFGGAFEMGIDAMFMCYLEDEERNDGTPGREKFAPRELQSYVGSLGDGSESSMKEPILHGTKGQY